MTLPDNERGAPCQEGAPRKLATKLAAEGQSTAVLGALDGSYVALTPAEVGEVRGRSYSPLAVQLLDTERAADRLLEELGATHCRRLAIALLELLQEVGR